MLVISFCILFCLLGLAQAFSSKMPIKESTEISSSSVFKETEGGRIFQVHGTKLRLWNGIPLEIRKDAINPLVQP